MAHRVRAILLARATAASLRGRRSSSPSSQGLAALLVGLAWRITAIAPTTSSWRSRSLPARLMPPRRWRPPVDRSRGVKPSQAAKWRADSNWLASTVAATGQGRERPDAGHRRQALADRVGLVPRGQALAELRQLRVQLLDA